ncbi:MAG: hypothetical protein NWE89_10390 [Candidatus Bathyarchaeota archaeon]|nr:hypothetical protein [Candidatus Bathyarchaeota archaeon]
MTSSFREKSSIMTEILQIERQIKTITENSRYRKLRNGLQVLELQRPGFGYVTIPDPNNLEQEIRVRRKSKETQNIITQYKKLIKEYEIELFMLEEKKKNLNAQKFPRKS